MDPSDKSSEAEEAQAAAESAPNLELGQLLGENPSYATTTLLLVFPYLSIADRLRCSRVCKLWNEIVASKTLWKSVTLAHHFLDFMSFTKFVKKYQVRCVKLNNCKYENVAMEEFAIVQNLSDVKSLEVIGCPSKLVEIILKEKFANLVTFKTELCCGSGLWNLPLNFLTMDMLTSVYIRCERYIPNIKDLLKNLGQLKHLELYGVQNLDCQEVFSFNFEDNPRLLTFGWGQSNKIGSRFLSFIHSLTALKKLRIEYCENWNVREICAGISVMPNLETLELVRFQYYMYTNSLYDGLKFLTNIKNLVLVPSPRVTIGCCNGEICAALPYLQHTLLKLDWGFKNRHMVFNLNPRFNVASVGSFFQGVISMEIYTHLEFKQKVEALVPNTRVNLFHYMFDYELWE